MCDSGDCLDITQITLPIGPAGNDGEDGNDGDPGEDGDNLYTEVVRWKVVVSQTSTNNPVVEGTLENTLTPTSFVRVSTGVYDLTKTGAFPDENKIYISCSKRQGRSSNKGDVYGAPISANVVRIYTENASEVLSDGIMSDTNILIEVYP